MVESSPSGLLDSVCCTEEVAAAIALLEGWAVLGAFITA
jgi:hypothetical protein